MTDDRDDAGEHMLAGIDLHAWRIPPARAVHGPSLLVRAVSATAAPARRVRTRWMLAALVLVNAAIAAVLVILLARPSETQTAVVARPAGGSVDAKVRELLQRLEQEQRELERKLAEIQELRALVAELSEKVRQYEAQDQRRERTVPKRERKRPEHDAPAPIDPFDSSPSTQTRVEPPPVNPFDRGAPSQRSSCDEVSCILDSRPDPCCAAYRRVQPVGDAGKTARANALPEALDRESISRGISAVKARIAACGRRSAAHGKVKLRVKVGANGRVTNVTVEQTPDAALGACVAAEVQRAVFARTRTGGSFSYPFVF